MEEDRITMSQDERDRLKHMCLVLAGKRTQVEAAELMGLSVRQVRRIQRRLEAEGDKGIVHRLRGRRSNRQKPGEFRCQVVEAYEKCYGDYGLTHACEKLAQRGLVVGKETLRRWLVAEGLWKARRRRDKHRRRRERRACFGELVQADGSHHDWLEGRGKPMVLLVMIDDATSNVTARFYPGETTEGYMDLLGRYVRRHGRMKALYTDRHSIFWGQACGKEPAKTQMTRALGELGIEWIAAYSPQAKGRVERFNGTAQDRLVKELRQAGASTLEEANEVLERVFLAWFNRWKTVEPSSPNDAHLPLGASMNLASILSVQEKRKVANDYTVRWENQAYQLLPPARPGLRSGWVTVEKHLDGSLHIRFKKQELAYHRIGPADAGTGALPPSPRSLSREQTPAEGRKKEGHAAATAGPSAVRLACGRSGRTPAEPCLPKGVVKTTKKAPWRPPEDHPWRKGFSLRRSHRKRTLLMRQTTGHS